jgi:hypothetical protein
MRRSNFLFHKNINLLLLKIDEHLASTAVTLLSVICCHLCHSFVSNFCQSSVDMFAWLKWCHLSFNWSHVVVTHLLSFWSLSCCQLSVTQLVSPFSHSADVTSLSLNLCHLSLTQLLSRLCQSLLSPLSLNCCHIPVTQLLSPFCH